MTAVLTRAEVEAQWCRTVSEKVFQQQIVNMARLLGYRLYHTFRSDHSPKGFPDLVLCNGGCLILAECKTAKGKLTPDQEGWLSDLREVGGVCGSACGCVAAYVWRPQHQVDGSIERILRGWRPTLAEITEMGMDR